MNTMLRKGRLAVTLTLVYLALATALSDDPIKFHGDVQLQPNGDAQIALRFDMPMLEYQRMRDNLSNLHLMLRELATQRAAAEVVDKNASYDDAGHGIDFSMTMKGAIRNLGDSWEFDVDEGLDFSNLDEGQRKVYFSEVTEGFGGKLRGSYSIQLPAGARSVSWDPARRVVRYELPAPGRGVSTPLGLAALAFTLLGVAILGASFVIKS